MNINLNLRNTQNRISPKAQKETPINLIIRWNGNRLVYPTKMKIEPHLWNINNQEARRTHPTYLELNIFLSNLKNKVRKAFTNFQNENNRIPSVSELRAHLKEVIEDKEKSSKPTRLTLLDLISLKIDRESKRLASQGDSVSSSSVVYAYRRLGEILTTFEEQTGNKIDFEDVTMDWYYDFMEFLSSNNYKPNYRGKLIKNLKAILNLANQEGHSSNLTHKNRNFKKEQETTYKVYLSEREINDLYSFDFEDNNKLARVRDLFIIACRTGLRISDLKMIHKDLIKESEIVDNGEKFKMDFIRIQTKKTKKVVDIPLHPNTAELLEKYNYNLPSISDTKFNEYIKDVCQKAGILELCVFTETQGNKVIKKSIPKYNLISSHTGRRSFATNHYKEDVPILSIMAITGHSKISDFLDYIVLDANEKAKSIAIHYRNKTQSK